MVLLIDNYDSFSYNLYQLVGEICQEAERQRGQEGHEQAECGCGQERRGKAQGECGQAGEKDPGIRVIRNDEMTVEDIRILAPDRIILSPGPGRPEDAGVCMDVIKSLGSRIPILGVCLGHQAICAAFGATVTYAKRLMHGKQSMVRFDLSSPLFKGCPEEAPVARYHSLAADENTLPEELKVTARTQDGEVMAVQHGKYPIYGVQFHPESIMTPDGKTILKNFIKEI